MANYIIYHQVKSGVDCPDGVISAWIAYRALQKRGITPTLIGDWYGGTFANVLCTINQVRAIEDNEIYILDFSYSESELLALAGLAKVTVIDHHVLDNVDSRSNIIEKLSAVGSILGKLDPTECGSTLTWKHFHPGKPLPNWLKFVRARDIGTDGYYQGNYPIGEAFNMSLSADRAGKIGVDSFHLYDRLNAPVLGRLEKHRHVRSGSLKIVLRNLEINSYIDRWLENPMYKLIESQRVPYFSLLKECKLLKANYSMLGAIAIKRLGVDDFVAISIDDPKRISLRSGETGTNVGLVALRLSKILNTEGGGHPHAAGYREP